MTSESGHLKTALIDKRKAVIVEFTPPAAAGAEAVRAAAAVLRGHVDAVSVADNRHGIEMSSIAAASLFRAEGIETIVHMTTRDRNRIALLSDVLGAQALGLSNILCTSGDHQTLGPDRAARNVYDLDAVQFLATLDRLRREGVLLGNGRKIQPCPLHLGAVASPQADPRELQTMRLAKKVEAGADFLITQPVFDTDEFGTWLESLREWEIADKAAIVAGVLAPPTGARAREMNATMPGVEIPDAVIGRLEAAGVKKERDEAITIAVEVIKGLESNPTIKGFCLMTEGDCEVATAVIKQCGLTRS